jgi:hypothetical protein
MVLVTIEGEAFEEIDTEYTPYKDYEECQYSHIDDTLYRVE